MTARSPKSAHPTSSKPHSSSHSNKKHHPKKKHHAPAKPKPKPKPKPKLPVAAPIVQAPAPTPATPTPPTPAPVTPAQESQIERLLWRAGFGPAPGQVNALVPLGLQGAVYSLTRPSGPAVLTGAAPVDENGQPLAPADQWGHDHCFWLDRMLRSNQQLVERMALIWHDWFATSNEKVNSQQLMLNQTDTFRSLGLGSFDDLFRAVTSDPAMLIFLDGTSNDQWDPNENYGREMMELFSLGADRGAYTEDDVRENARALTGWRNDWTAELGNYNFRFDSSYHDTGTKTIFGQSGNFNWTDSVQLCVSHPLHPSFFVTKLWGYFVPTPIDAATQSQLEAIYTQTSHNIAAVVEAILQHPDLYAADMIVEPVVYTAALLRSVGATIETTAWSWLDDDAGQRLYYPPNVSGWDYTRWLDTTTIRARWMIADYVNQPRQADPWANPPTYDGTETPEAALDRAYTFWNYPALTAESQAELASFATTALPSSIADWEQVPYRAMRQNALRLLIAASPDMQAR